MKSERVFRIGDKLISLNKVERQIERVLELREQGLSQLETAQKLNLDRSFISRLETCGEIRKGGRVAVIGFPVANADQLTAVCSDYGLDFYLLLNNKERWDMVRDQQALDFFDRMLELVSRLREFDTLVMITSEKWYHLAEALLDVQIIHLNIGPTPVQEDQPVPPERLKDILVSVLESDKGGSN